MSNEAMEQHPVTTAPTIDSRLEVQGLDFVEERERHGKPIDLFWIYAPGSLGTFGIAYGGFVLALGLGVWQAIVACLVGGIVGSVFCGIISLAGKRGNAPTMVLSRAIFGVRGNRLPNAISWFMSAGWQTIQAATAALATSTVLARLGLPGGPLTQAIALLVIMAAVLLIGMLGHRTLMAIMKILTPISILLTVGYVAMTAQYIHWPALAAVPSGSIEAMVGGILLILTGTGVTLCRVSADYSRFLPRSSRSSGVVLWPIIGSGLPIGVLMIFGILLSASNPEVGKQVTANPVGALTTLLPIWYLIPFALIVVATAIASCSIDAYSASLALLAVGVRIKQHIGVVLIAVVTTLVSLYIIFSGTSFFVQFQGILITLGIPIAAWAGMMCTDVILRRRDYDDSDLRSPRGRYGDIRWSTIVVLAIASIVGWGLVTNSAAGWLDWQGYFLAPFGGKSGVWATANLGVLAAVLVGAVGYLLVGWRSVHRQESLPLSS